MATPWSLGQPPEGKEVIVVIDGLAYLGCRVDHIFLTTGEALVADYITHYCIVTLPKEFMYK